MGTLVGGASVPTLRCVPMHQTALEFGNLFFNTYVAGETGLSIIDVGSQDVCGSLRSVAPLGSNYIGIDFAAGKRVDIIISDPYCLPVDDNSADVVVSSSCFEHSEFFWLVYNEILRILKPSGIFYLNAPQTVTFTDTLSTVGVSIQTAVLLFKIGGKGAVIQTFCWSRS